MGRAEDLFERLKQGGETAIDELIEQRQAEELFLDFKRSADGASGRRLHDNDRQNLARAISGFGNSEGGVIIWGVDCRERRGIVTTIGHSPLRTYHLVPVKSLSLSNIGATIRQPVALARSSSAARPSARPSVA